MQFTSISDRDIEYVKSIRISRITEETDPISDILSDLNGAQIPEIIAPYDIYEVVAEVDGDIPTTALSLTIDLDMIAQVVSSETIFTAPFVQTIRSKIVKLVNDRDGYIEEDLPCSDDFDPVCGVPKYLKVGLEERKTFQNSCVMEKEGSQLFHADDCSNSPPVLIVESSSQEVRRVSLPSSSVEVARIVLENSLPEDISVKDFSIQFLNTELLSIPDVSNVVMNVYGENFIMDEVIMDENRNNSYINPVEVVFSKDSRTSVSFFADIANDEEFDTAIDLDSIIIKTENNDTVESNKNILYGPAIERNDLTGAIDVSLDISRTPDSAIALAGEEIPVAVYKFTAEREDMKVEELMFHVTSDSSVESLSLYNHSTGEPVLNYSGTVGVASVVGQKAFFEVLDLTIPEDETVSIEVRANIDGIDNSDLTQTAVSGDVFSVQLDHDNKYLDITGSESGSSISILPVDMGNEFTVYNNKVLVSKLPISSTNLSIGTQEVLKLDFDVQGDNEAKLHNIKVEISGAAFDGDALVSREDALISKLYLKEDGEIISIVDSSSIGYSNGSSLVRNANFNLMDLLPPIKDDAVYTIEAEFLTIPEDANAYFGINVNGYKGFDNGIGWVDYGDDGTNTDPINWIDVGDYEASSISNRLSN